MKAHPFVRTKLERYKINVLWLNNLDKLSVINDNSLKDIDSKVKEWKNYTSLVNTIFDSMNKEYAQILKAIYLEHKSADELHYCTSTFYLKHKQAVNQFLEFFKFNDIC